MTREEFIEEVVSGATAYCPKPNECTNNASCRECIVKEYEKQIRADAIDDFVNALLYGRDKTGVEILVFGKDAKKKLLKMAEQLKEQVNE